MTVIKDSYCIIGYGVSGKAAAKLLAHMDVTFTVCDANPASIPNDDRQWLRSTGCTFADEQAMCESIDTPGMAGVILSPGIAQTHPVVQKARSCGIPVMSEVGFALEQLQKTKHTPKIIGITGTNGKTTTVHMLDAILKNAGFKSVMGGNMGVAVSKLAIDNPDADVYVLELSSYQLELSDGWHLDGAAVTNITPDHCDRYQDMDSYARAKLKIDSLLGDNGFFICRSEDALWFSELIGYPVLPQHWYMLGCRKKQNLVYCPDKNGLWHCSHAGWEIAVGVNDVHFHGKHFFEDCAIAATAAHLLGVDADIIISTIKHFNGLPHRLERVGEKNGVAFYNDSKATNVDAVMKALDSFHEPLILILGGQDKGADLSQLREIIRKKVSTLVLIGESTPYYESFFAGAAPILKASTMEDAVCKAYHHAQSGDVVLLSPACASFDMYDNFEQRGNAFKTAVMDIQKVAT